MADDTPIPEPTVALVSHAWPPHFRTHDGCYYVADDKGVINVRERHLLEALRVDGGRKYTRHAPEPGSTPAYAPWVHELARVAATGPGPGSTIDPNPPDQVAVVDSGVPAPSRYPAPRPGGGGA